MRGALFWHFPGSPLSFVLTSRGRRLLGLCSGTRFPFHRSSHGYSTLDTRRALSRFVLSRTRPELFALLVDYTPKGVDILVCVDRVTSIVPRSSRGPHDYARRASVLWFVYASPRRNQARSDLHHILDFVDRN